ncbi:MAG: PepSY domain-containing protein [Bacteroidales bacterium]
MKKKGELFRRLHKWPGLIVAFFLILFSLSGIVLNHRALFADINVSREYLPQEYEYENWNNASVKGNLIISGDSVLVYGNIGIWLTDSTFRDYKSLNAGLGKGADLRKVSDVHICADGHWYASTHFGLYAYDHQQKLWQRLVTKDTHERFVGLEAVGDSIYALSRNYIYSGLSAGMQTSMHGRIIATPKDYKKEVSLFRTIWQLHSGEIFGMVGKLLVDTLGVVTIVLSVTGIVYFFFPGVIRRRRRRQKNVERLGTINNWSLKWHNKLGAWTFVALTFCYLTGMFLRPPLLIPIAGSTLAPIKFSKLDSPNAWNDKLRDFVYDKVGHRFLVCSADGMFFMDMASLSPQWCTTQPPVSVMGINCFERFTDMGAYLIGSFSGLFLWHPNNPVVYDFVTGRPYSGKSMGMPIGSHKIAGLIKDLRGNRYMLDYSNGLAPLYHDGALPQMPANVRMESGMSLWSLSLEVHTARIFQCLLGNFYILIVPLTGIVSVVVTISGYVYWRKKFRRKRKNRGKNEGEKA